APGGDLSPSSFLLRDLTGDGFVDAVYGNTTSGRIGFLTNDSTGILRTATPSGPTTGSFQLANGPGGQDPEFFAADLNRDGMTDLLVRVANNGVDILLGQRDG